MESDDSHRRDQTEVTPAFTDQELITNRSTRVTYWKGGGANQWKRPQKTG
jgi:hypothetical protein